MLEDNYKEIISELEKKVEQLETRLKILERVVDNIENDIYEDEEEGFDFEIVCPYCNNEFVTQIVDGEELVSEVNCPECNNVIELDWNSNCEDEGCSGHCHGCGCEDECDDDCDCGCNDDLEDDM